MAEQGPRCRRRKQTNPRKKNGLIHNREKVINGEYTISSISKHVPRSERGRRRRKKQNNSNKSNVNTAETVEMPELEHLGPEDGRSPPLNGFHSPKRMVQIKEQSSNIEQSDMCPAAVDKDKKGREKEERGDGSGRPTSASSSGGERSDVSRDDEMKSEEEKIREYMRRSDTAVIFPEAVDNDKSPPSNELKGQKQKENQDNSNEYSLKCHHCDNHVFTGIHALNSLRDHLKNSHGESEVLSSNSNNHLGDCHRNDRLNNLEEEEESEVKLSSPVVIPANDGSSGPYRCDKCSASFSNIDRLEKHLLLHSPTTQSCRVCHKTFANVYRLQRHMISHDESAVLRKFKCPECDKAFKFKHHLKEHIRIHSGEKPFECPNCGKRFSHSGSYSSHMTSKKCLVVNLKVRRNVDRSIRGKRNIQNNNNNNNIFRPIIPKYGDEHQEMFYNSTSVPSSSHTTSPVTVSTYLGHNEPFPPAAAAMLTGSYSQPSMQPFLPNSTFSSVGLHPLLASHLHNSGVSPNPYLPSSIASSLAAMAATLPDLHQNFRYKDDVKMLDKRQEIRKSSSMIKEEDLDSQKAANNKEDVEVEKKDLKAVRKILEIVDATAKKQKFSPINDSDDGDKKAVKSETEGDSVEDSEILDKCRYCSLKFENRIALHQHERYLCPENKDLITSISESKQLSPSVVKSEIKAEMIDSMPDDCKPGSSIGTCDSDDDSARDNNDEDNGNLEEGRKWRVRSLFSEEHLHVLKSFYKINPRPKKYDVERLANQIGFATRVVQVWFQNMRARDRRRGRHIQVPYFPSNGGTQPSSKSFPPSNQPAYPSLVPPYNGISSPNHLSRMYAQQSPPLLNERPNISLPPGGMYSNGQYLSPSSSPTNLSSKSSLNQLSSPTDMHHGTFDDQPLDLSMKSMKDENEDNALNLSRKSSRTSTPSRESNNCSIPENLSKNDIPIQYVGQQSEGLASQFLSTLKSRSLLSGSEKAEIRYLQRNPPTTLSSLQHILSIPPLHPLPEHSSNQAGNLPKILSIQNDAVHSPNSYSLSGYNSDDALVIDDGSGKTLPKRPWPHIEADDSLEDDPLKQGKPWKQQKHLDGFAVEDGMYSCDQCDKMFSKQSSLARHKYEHSGQRPHKCEQCGKAFKHKHHLTEHRRLHSGEKPFQCKKCLKRFSHSGSYSQHMNHRYSYCKPYRE